MERVIKHGTQVNSLGRRLQHYKRKMPFSLN